MTDSFDHDAHPTLNEPTWRHRPDALSRRAGGTVVLLGCSELADDNPVMLSGSAAAVWDLLEFPATLGSLSKELADTYNADRDEVTRGVQALLNRLRSEGLLERSS